MKLPIAISIFLTSAVGFAHHETLAENPNTHNFLTYFYIFGILLVCLGFYVIKKRRAK